MSIGPLVFVGDSHAPSLRVTGAWRRCVDHLIDLVAVPAPLRLVEPHLIADGIVRR